jgi:Ran GTPase-activating protein (RanGAP) involved in mRNA processing and transport
MSVSKDSTSTGTVENGIALLSSTFLDFCAKVRNNDPSILPALGEHFKIRPMCEREGIELADALLENTVVTYLQLETGQYTKSSAEAMAKFVRNSKHLQHIKWNEDWDAVINDRELGLCHREEMFSCFLPAIQESTSLKKLHMEWPSRGRPSNLALENMLTHTQSLRSLKLIFPDGELEDVAMAAVQSGLKKNTTLRELTLEFSRGAATVFPILTTLRDHPLLRRLCLRGQVVDLTELKTVLQSKTSKITELDINRSHGGPMIGLTRVLRALAQRPTLTKLGLRYCPLGRNEVRLIRTALCNTPSLNSLDLAWNNLGSAELAELAPALYHNTSIKVLDMSGNSFDDMECAIECARLLRDIIHCNKTITTLDLSWNHFGRNVGAVEFIAEGMGSNSTLLKIDLLICDLGDGGVSTLAQSLGSRNTTLQKLALGWNNITSAGVGVLLETMEQCSLAADIDLHRNPIGNEGASLLARSLGNNALPNLTRLSISSCGIGDDGCIALVSALEQNASLLQLDLRDNHRVSERAFLALAESLPEIKVLQRVDFSWCIGLASAMSLLLAGLRENTSLFRFHVDDCAPHLVPPTPEETARSAGGWMQEMEHLGYRNRFRTFIRVSKERLPPRGVWSHALARVSILPDVIFEVLRSKPSLVPSEDTEDKEAAKDTGVPTKRKRGDD